MHDISEPLTSISDLDPYQHIRSSIAEYSANFLPHQPGSHLVQGKYVALSGATGNVGASMLDILLRMDDITKVYLLNRRSKESAKASLTKTFMAKGLDRRILEERDAVIDYLVVDFSKKDLGLEPNLYSELRDNVTHIIHSAWFLNFMSDLDSFKSTHIAGVRHLIDLALSSPQAQPPRLSFLSTIGAAILYQGPCADFDVGIRGTQNLVPECPIDDPSMALDIGYGESKYVSERIIVNALKAGLRATVIRVGQLSGMSTSGEWPSNEYGIILLKSVLELGLLPEDVPPFRWTPSDIAASAIIKQSFVDGPSLQYFAVENPFPTNNEYIKKALVSCSHKPIRGIHWTKWLDYIETNELDPRKVPAVLLASFYRDRWNGYKSSAALAWNNSVKVAPELAQGELGTDLIQKYIRYFTERSNSRTTVSARL